MWRYSSIWSNVKKKDLGDVVDRFQDNYTEDLRQWSPYDPEEDYHFEPHTFALLKELYNTLDENATEAEIDDVMTLNIRKLAQHLLTRFELPVNYIPRRPHSCCCCN